MKLTIEIQTGDRGEILTALHNRIRVCERMALQLESVSVATARLYRTEIEQLERIVTAILHAELIDTVPEERPQVDPHSLGRWLVEPREPYANHAHTFLWVSYDPVFGQAAVLNEVHTEDPGRWALRYRLDPVPERKPRT